MEEKNFGKESYTTGTVGGNTVCTSSQPVILSYAPQTLLDAILGKSAPGQKGYANVALELFNQMQAAGCSPDAVTLASVLTSCGSAGALDEGALVDMYVRCGEFEKAIEVFDKLPVHDVVSWNVLIGGYAQHGYNKQALKCFYDMQARGVCPNPITFSFVLKVCSNVGDLEMGEKLQTQILREHMSEQDIGISNAVIDMYSRCGSLIKAREVFNAVSKKNTATWNALIAGYCQHGHYEEALGCFRQMQLEGFRMDEITASCMFKVCGNLRALDEGNAIHLQAVKEGLLQGDVVGTNALIDMYTKCNALEEAQNVFDKLHDRDVVSWNAVIRISGVGLQTGRHVNEEARRWTKMALEDLIKYLIGGYSQKGYPNVALELFNQMQAAGCSPDAVTLASVLTSCGSAGALDQGALVDMYVRCGEFEKAIEVFDKLPVHDVLSWNVLIGGYAQHGYNKQALKCFYDMQARGVCPNPITFSFILKVCSNVGDLEMGKKLQTQILREHMSEQDIGISNAVIDMYSRCGSLIKAREVFNAVSKKNTTTWNALIAGYCQHGHYEEALGCFRQMQLEGFRMDEIIASCMFKVCGNLRALDEGNAIHLQAVKEGLLQGDVVGTNALIDMYTKCNALEEAQNVFDKLHDRDAVSWNAVIRISGMGSRGKRFTGHE
ncbi:hypothetical protein KP509_33G058900 [Ceratopteris richardii]|uniref:Pentatricopeptide repeat-containing protein n=1 Tax=Ceratopteris richardii TaxID=49495 RepID=A0A8T2QQ68_CERRI|nr:hypothetical protein KP509_33G058900 [Ceratopteris richardii]